jgi:biotin carboxyl carrier protein
MRFNLLIDGQDFDVELGMGKAVVVKVNGQVYRAKPKRTSKGWTVSLDKKKYQVEIDVQESEIAVNGRKHTVEIKNLRRGTPSLSCITDVKGGGARRSKDGVFLGEEKVTPPMPGKVVTLKVKEGEKVKPGTPLLVLEAMKMQNEIVSNTDGVVREIRVSEGDFVESRDILVIIGSC